MPKDNNLKTKQKSSAVATIDAIGIDNDPKDQPTYPMRTRFEGDNQGKNWESPEPQDMDVEILQSTEHIKTPAVFGNTVPPKGLSGMIRRFAYTKSESSLYRWFPLVLADRVDMVEGLIEDLLKGHIPNIWKERGLNAALKHNPKGLFIKFTATSAIAYGTYRYFKKKK